MKNSSTSQRTGRMIAAAAALAAAAVMGQGTMLRAELISASIASAADHITFSNITQTVDDSYTKIDATGGTKYYSGSPDSESLYNSPVASGASANFPVFYHGSIAEFPTAGTLGLQFSNLNHDAVLKNNTLSVYAATSNGQGTLVQTVHVTLAFELTYPNPQAMPRISAYEFGGNAYQDPGTTVTMSGTLKVTAKPNGVLSTHPVSSSVTPTIPYAFDQPATDWTATATTDDGLDTSTTASSVFEIVYDTTLQVTSPNAYGTTDFPYATIDKGDVVFTVPAYIAPPDGGSTPEPATIGLLGGASMLLLARRRNRR